MPRFVVMILERMDNQTRHHNLLITEKQKKLKNKFDEVIIENGLERGREKELTE